MVINLNTVHCLCDFPGCKEEIIQSSQKSHDVALLIVKKQGWDFKINNNKIEIYCKLHKHKLRR